jgi:hypothetical protein
MRLELPYKHLTRRHKDRDDGDGDDGIDFDALKAVSLIAGIQVVLVMVIALTVHLLVTTDDSGPVLHAAVDRVPAMTATAPQPDGGRQDYGQGNNQ